MFRAMSMDRDNDAFPTNNECPVCHGHSLFGEICSDCKELCEDL